MKLDEKWNHFHHIYQQCKFRFPVSSIRNLTTFFSLVRSPGELCLVKLYDEYYRAILTDTKYKNRDRYELIDYGYILPVKKENIRRLPDHLLFPCITMKCFLDGKARLPDLLQFEKIFIRTIHFSVLPPINTKKSTLTDKELTKLQECLPQYELRSFKRIKAIKLHNCCVCSI